MVQTPRLFILILLFPSVALGQMDPLAMPIDRRTAAEQDLPRTAIGGTQTHIVPPGETEVMQGERVAPVVAPPAAIPVEEPVDPNKYICGRGDVFDLNFWGQQNFRIRITVDIEGRTFIPKVGYVDILGKPLAEARTAIKNAAHRYYPGLNVDISLAQPRSFQVHVVGFVGRPGVYVSNPLQRAGSLLVEPHVTGSRRRIEIRHRNGTRTTADLVLYELTGDTRNNPYLMDGDIIDVPSAHLSASIGGSVQRPGRYELVDTKDVDELLRLAGGVSPEVTRELPIRLVHRDEHERNIEDRFSFTADGRVPDRPLHDGDSVYIPSVSELQRSIILVGPFAGASAADEVTAVKRLPFVEHSTVRSVIESVGAIGTTADLANAYIRKRDGRIVPVDLEALLVRRELGADKPLEVADTLVVPQKRRSVAVEGAVLHPAQYPFDPRFSPHEYLALAGGPSKQARSESNFRLITADGKQMDLARAKQINPGDTIVVPERTFSRSEVVSIVLGIASLAVSTAAIVIVLQR